jgi:hypothetical protein
MVECGFYLVGRDWNLCYVRSRLRGKFVVEGPGESSTRRDR